MRKTSSRLSTPHIKPVPCNTTTTSYDVLRLILYERFGNPSPLHVESTLLLAEPMLLPYLQVFRLATRLKRKLIIQLESLKSVCVYF